MPKSNSKKPHSWYNFPPKSGSLYWISVCSGADLDHVDGRVGRGFRAVRGREPEHSPGSSIPPVSTRQRVAAYSGQHVAAYQSVRTGQRIASTGQRALAWVLRPKYSPSLLPWITHASAPGTSAPDISTGHRTVAADPTSVLAIAH
eukprot:3941692-Rhodomonas_salina.1